MKTIRICKSPHGNIAIFAMNIPNELKMFFGMLDIWGYIPNGRTGCEPYVTYEVDKSLKGYFKSQAFTALLGRFRINQEQVKIELN